MRELLRIFNHPERGVFTVVIAGTKGKGSTGYFLSEILRKSRLRVGFYHSPHLQEPRERIWLGGKPISRREFAKGLWAIQKRLREARSSAFTYFEIMTLLASLLFKEKKVDVAIYEAGMGGRLDATHVFPAKLALLTPIHFDHEAFLGDTLTEIAHEKACILKPRQDVVVAPQKSEAFREIQKMARKRHCRIWNASQPKRISIGLLGDFQRLNAAVALSAAALLRDRHRLPVTSEGILNGLKSHHWPGRMEIFKGRPDLLLDGAHNPQSIEALTRNLKRLFPRRRKILIFGTSRDKKSERMIPYLSKVFPVCLLTQSDNPRAKEVAALLKEARSQFSVLIPAADSKQALALARRLARPRDLVVATGSFYLIGEVRSQCRN